jgi:hypothetical protein
MVALAKRKREKKTLPQLFQNQKRRGIKRVTLQSNVPKSQA